MKLSKDYFIEGKIIPKGTEVRIVEKRKSYVKEAINIFRESEKNDMVESALDTLLFLNKDKLGSDYIVKDYTQESIVKVHDALEYFFKELGERNFSWFETFEDNNATQYDVGGDFISSLTQKGSGFKTQDKFYIDRTLINAMIYAVEETRDRYPISGDVIPTGDGKINLY